MRQTLYIESGATLSKRESLLVLEIDRDKIDSASMFVDYISQSYGFSKSTVWHNLVMLKAKGIVDFASKAEAGKPLSLTDKGLAVLSRLAREKHEIMHEFEQWIYA